MHHRRTESVATEPAAPAGEVIFDSGPAVWERRRPVRGLLFRLAGVCILIASVISVLVGGPAALASLFWQGNMVAAASTMPRPVYNAPWTRIALPTEAASHPGLSVAANAGSHGRMFACWVAPDTTGAPAAFVATEPSFNAAWSVIRLPVPQATHCQVVTDSIRSGSAILIVWQQMNDSACPEPSIYVISAANEWQSLHWPAHFTYACSMSFALVDRSVYVTANHSLLSSDALPSQTAGHVLVVDLGTSRWHTGDTGLGSSAALTLVAMRAKGNLLGETRAQSLFATSDLWQSSDAGQHWHWIATMPAPTAIALASSDPAATGADGFGSIYAAIPDPQSVPGAINYQTLFQLVAPVLPDSLVLATTGPAHVWSSIPPPPDLTGTPGRPWGVTVPDAAVGPDGHLLFIRALPVAQPSIIIPPYAIWTWSPQSRQWRAEGHSLAPDTTIQNISWSSGVMRTWVTLVTQGLHSQVILMTFALGQ